MFKSANALPSSPIAGITSRLAALRRQLKVRVLVQGVSRLLWLLMLVAILDLALDWFIRFDWAQRAVLWVLVLSFVSWACYRWLWLPLLAPVSDDALALTIEQAHPRLQQRLISGLQLSRLAAENTSGLSPVLVQRAIQAAAQLAGEVSFESCLDGPRHRRNLGQLVAGALGIALLAFSVSVASPLQTWFRRNVLLTSAEWPKDTILLVESLREDGTLVLARGQEATLAIQIGEGSRVIPSAVGLDLRSGHSESNLALTRVSPRRFEGKLAALSEPFEFRARGGDGETAWVRAMLVDPPAIVELELTVTPPAYTGLRAETLLPGQGPYLVLPGSRLRVSATTNKLLASADLIADGAPLLAASSQQETSQADRPPSGAASIYSLQITNKRLTGDLSPLDVSAGAYRFALRDAWGLANLPGTAFAIERRLDREPNVSVELAGTSRLVTPNAQIGLRYTATDDFGLTSLAARLAWTPEGENATTQQLVIDLATAAANPLQSTPDRVPVAAEVRLERVLDLTTLKIPPPAALELRVEAVDNDTIGGPKLGVSSTVSLRVVTENELRADLLRREKELRAEFASIAKEQFELLTETRVLAASLAGDSEWPLASKQQLAAGQRQQRLIGERTATIAERCERMALEIVNNRLEAPGSALASRLTQQIATPLQSLAQDLVPAAAEALHQTRLAAAGEPRAQAFAATITRQEELARQMQLVLDQMAQAENFQEAVNLLYEIEKAQLDVHQQTDKARQERIRRILEGNPAN